MVTYHLKILARKRLLFHMLGVLSTCARSMNNFSGVSVAPREMKSALELVNALSIILGLSILRK